MAGLFRVYARRPFLFTTPTPVSSSICHISDHWHSRLLRAELLNALIASNRMAPAIFARGERVLYGPARVGM
jgi:hypothetical protein